MKAIPAAFEAAVPHRFSTEFKLPGFDHELMVKRVRMPPSLHRGGVAALEVFVAASSPTVALLERWRARGDKAELVVRRLDASGEVVETYCLRDVQATSVAPPETFDASAPPEALVAIVTFDVGQVDIQLR
jgi:hypothetical protein